jgi:hypothetical protein
MPNNESSAWTVADRVTKDEEMQVSQHSSKPLSYVYILIKLIKKKE